MAADDEPDSLELLAAALASRGCEVHTARDASEAFHLLCALRPDVLVSDIAMPGEDGYTLIRRVRALPRGEGGGVPAVALSAFARQQDHERALEAGFDRYLTKPLDLDRLFEVLERVCGGERSGG